MLTRPRALPCSVLALGVLVASVLGLAACGQREDPAPPAVLRFDGLYRSDPRPSGPLLVSKYLRFYADGAVLGASSPREPREVATWLRAPFETHGDYVLEGASLRFTCTSPQGRVDHQGEVLPDGLRLTWRSHINDKDGETRYRFVKTPR